jgi:hypothetical protein
MTKPLACLRNHRCIYYWGHFFDVIEQEPVEEDFVRILERAQINVPLQVIVLSFVSLVSTDELLLKALDVRRKKSV